MNISVHIKKFKQEMERQHFSVETVKNYCSCATSYLAYFIKTDHPLHITDDQFADYLYENFKDQNTQRANHSSVKKFYSIVFGKERFRYLPYAKKKETQIIILSEDEVTRLLQATTNLKHFCITLLFYSTGIRMNELLNIEYLRDIDISIGVIYVMGKGAKPRPVTMKPKLLEVIQAYVDKYHPEKWLFENDQTHKQYSETSINLFLKANAKKAGITKRVYAHLLRHCYASHSIMISGLYMVQEILGHSDPKITASTYIHNSPKLISQAFSPIDSLPDSREIFSHKNKIDSKTENKSIGTVHNIVPTDSAEEFKKSITHTSEETKKKISMSPEKTYNILFNGKNYLLKEINHKIVEAPEGARWSIGVMSEKAIGWFERKGAVVSEK